MKILMMTSTQNYNSQNKENAEDLLSAFSFSLDTFQETSEKEILDKLQKNLSKILKKEFPSTPEKHNFDFRERADGTRLNFACPYCGDSTKVLTKKRGNIYIPGFNYHCYNCRTHTDLETFLSDFDLEIESKDKVYIFQENEAIKKDLKTNSSYLDFSHLTDFNLLEKYGVDREEIIKKFNLSEITARENWWIKKYLTERFQTNFKVFANDKKLNRFFIFNLTPNGKVIGYQVRNFKRDPKYVTHTLEMIYEHLGKQYDKSNKALKEVNRLSFLFGLSTVNFNKQITVFEGPLDSFLFENGMSVCGIDNDFPLDIPIRWMYDYDNAGIKKSIEKLNNGGSVFLWRKYLKDLKFKLNVNKLDFTDLMKYIKQKEINKIPFDSYFTSDKYDAYIL